MPMLVYGLYLKINNLKQAEEDKIPPEWPLTAWDCPIPDSCSPAARSGYNARMNDSAKIVAQAFVRAINRQDVDALGGLMTETHRFVDSLGGVVEGRETVRAAWAAYFRLVPDYTLAVEETYRTGPVVIMLGIAQGTLVPDAEPKPENRWQTPAAIRAFVEEGEVAEWRIYADNEPIRAILRKRE